MQKRFIPFRLQRKPQWKDFFLFPAWLRMLAVSTVSLLLLTAVFFMTGHYLYSPQKVARDYYEAMLAQDWNRMYDCCRFPERQFLSRENFVNAMSYGVSGGDTPAIKNYRMRRNKGSDAGEYSEYTVTYSLEGVSEVQSSTVKIARGSRVMGPFYEWYIVPEDLYTKNVEIAAPKKAEFYLDGVRISQLYEKETAEESEEAGADGETVYEIPYMFLGYHTARIHEAERTDYREIFSVKDNRRREFLPELKLNDSTGKAIADMVEEAVQEFCAAGMKKDPYSKIRNYFSGDSAVQKKAEKDFAAFCGKVADDDNAGIVNLTVTNIDTTVSSADGKMKAAVSIAYTAECVESRFFFFHRTVTKSGTKNLELEIGNSKGEWRIEAWSK